eukprot:24797-Alexandrium_andersonii.AAC.1
MRRPLSPALLLFPPCVLCPRHPARAPMSPRVVVRAPLCPRATARAVERVQRGGQVQVPRAQELLSDEILAGQACRPRAATACTPGPRELGSCWRGGSRRGKAQGFAKGVTFHACRLTF